MSGQRRRGPPKRAPKNIFGGGATKEPKKPQNVPRPKASTPKTITVPPKVAGSIPPPKLKKKKIPKVEETIAEETIAEEIAEETKIVQEQEIVVIKEEKVEGKPAKKNIAAQILGTSEKKSRGLKQKKGKGKAVKDPSVQSDRAAALIELSRKRAMVPVPKVVVKEKVVKPPPRRRRQKSSYQPAARAKRLNRSRHMEYKYEMRKLLQDINVSEEHRSNLLGTIWAKGERKTSSDAKLFLEEKLGEGAINEEQKSRLEKVIDNYTIRR
ncbi:MAG: hypothetical protein OR994_03375 [Candidatus Poseidoniales archaeon]|nr:hypothetical protein [Candidatus Poseidoniales archaeon]